MRKLTVNSNEISSRNSERGGNMKLFVGGTGLVSDTHIVGEGGLEFGDENSLHVHDYGEEFIYVTKGYGTVQIGDKKQKIAKGDFVLIPKGTPHKIVNQECKKLAYLFSCSPLAPVPELGHRDLFNNEKRKKERNMKKLTVNSNEVSFTKSEQGGNMKLLAGGTGLASDTHIVGKGKLEIGEENELHAHDYGEEFIYVTKGCGKIQIEDKKQKIAKGDFVLIPKGTPHKIINKKCKKLVYIFACSPLAPNVELAYRDLSNN